MLVQSIYKKIITCVILGLTLSALFLMLGNGGNVPLFPPLLVFTLVGLSLFGAIIFPFTWQYFEREHKMFSLQIYGVFYFLIRYSIAFNIACFGWKKLFGLQFVVPIDIAALPMNQQSGEWLTWYYFGHSFVFGIVLSLFQIDGAFLLLFRRTLLLGSIILFAFMFNLTLINIFYQMNVGALIQSIILTLGILFLILLDYKRLVQFFLKAKNELPSIKMKSTLSKNLVRFSVILFSLLFTWYLKSLMDSGMK